MKKTRNLSEQERARRSQQMRTQWGADRAAATPEPKPDLSFRVDQEPDGCIRILQPGRHSSILLDRSTLPSFIDAVLSKAVYA